MIRVDENYIKDIEKKNRQARTLLIIASLIIFLLGALVYFVVIQSPFYYCDKWGGTLYENNHCYDLNNMDKCLDPKGNLQDSSQAILVNWGVLE